MSHMAELMFQVTFQGCELQKDWHIPEQSAVLGPRCQCYRQARIDRRRRWRKLGRYLTLPEWVFVSDVRDKPGSNTDLIEFPPRHRVVEREKQCPLVLRGTSRFHQAANVNRCVVDANTPFVYKKVDGAMKSAMTWVQQLQSQYKAYFGEIGSTKFMSDLLSDMACAFDWEHFLEASVLPIYASGF